MPTTEPHPPRTRITLRISEHLLADARNLGIDLDAAVEAGLESAIRRAQIAGFESHAADLSTKAADRGLTEEKLEEILSNAS